MTIKVFSKIRSIVQFELFWASITKKASTLDIDEPSLPRNRKRPKRYDSGSEQYCPITVQELFCKHYFEILDHAINSISRFDQPGYASYKKVESLLIKCVSIDEDFTEEFEFVTSFYSGENPIGDTGSSNYYGRGELNGSDKLHEATNFLAT